MNSVVKIPKVRGWVNILTIGVFSVLMACSNPLGMANTTKASYAVSYNGNGNTGGTVPTDGNAYVVGASVTVSLSKPSRSGYSFTSWNTKAGGTGLNYLPGATFSMGDSNVTLYAQWSANPTYTVTYMANATSYTGTVPVDVNGYVSGATVTVADNSGVLAQVGYNFIGWNTAADGTGTSYAAGSTFLMGGADVVLYAKWTNAPTFTVTYSANGASGGTAPTDTNGYLSGASAVVRGNTGNLVKTGYTFAGWNTASDGSGTNYSIGSTLANITANKTLYAKWTNLPTYKVTYACTAYDGGNVPTDSNAYTSGSSVVVLGNTGNLTRAGYAFTGWNTQPDGSGASYSSGSSLIMGSANTTLYAQWAVLSWGVTYVGNGSDGGTVPLDSTLYSQGQTVTVSGAGTMTRSGYTFAGWNTKADGTGTSYAANSSLTMGTSAVILYAIWSVLPTYTITYNSSGGSGTVSDSKSYLPGTVVTVLSGSALTKAGYSFNGWKDSSNNDYIPGSTLSMPAGGITLYAQWTNTATTGWTVSTPSQYVAAIIGNVTVTYGSLVYYSTVYSGNASSYKWYLNGTQIASGSTFSPNISAPTWNYGNNVLTLMVSDTNGLTYSTSITVAAGN